MNEEEVRRLLESFAGVETQTAHGYTFFFVGADRMLPFATMANEDNDHDSVSNLNRPNVYRLNLGVRSETYRKLFGRQPKSPGASGVVDTGHDFTTLDQLLPHPVYAPQSWICVLSPSEETLERVRPLLREAYERAVEREAKKKAAVGEDG